ncbi:MAG TPA: ABC transporter permease [Gaiellaceae bacterium]|jgi:peptide/nickel transport system permease protein|nr:ABC transporter permease [Gaiellaceae bacterium]
MWAFAVRRLLLAVAVLAAVSFGTFALMATKFSSTCISRYTPLGVANPPLASNVDQAANLYWEWVKGIPSGRSFGVVCGGEVAQKVGPAALHTAALLGSTALLVVVFSLLLGTLAATRAGSTVDVLLRGFSYAGWAIPSFVLALVLQSILSWAGRTYGFHWFALTGWPGSCSFNPGSSVSSCEHTGGAFHHMLLFVRHLAVPAVALSVAFIGLHSRYLRSSLLVALNAPYTTTARAKGLPERTVVLRHALRNSLSTFTSALLLDLGAIFGAAMAVDAIFNLNGLGALLLTEIGGIGGGDGPRYLNPYAIETLLMAAAALVIASSVVAEISVASLDPRARLR